MANQPFAQRIARAAGKGWYCLFCWNAFDIEKMVDEKMANSSFSRAADYGMRAPGAEVEANLPWV